MALDDPDGDANEDPHRRARPRHHPRRAGFRPVCKRSTPRPGAGAGYHRMHGPAESRIRTMDMKERKGAVCSGTTKPAWPTMASLFCDRASTRSAPGRPRLTAALAAASVDHGRFQQTVANMQTTMLQYALSAGLVGMVAIGAGGGWPGPVRPGAEAASQVSQY